jgi:hypothetical protein
MHSYPGTQSKESCEHIKEVGNYQKDSRISPNYGLLLTIINFKVLNEF